MDFLGFYINYWVQIFDYTGSATRKEVWIITLINALIIIVSIKFISAYGSTLAVEFSNFILIILTIPTISISVRRLRDAGFSPWLMLINFIPVGGFVLLYIWFFSPSDPSAEHFIRTLNSNEDT